MNKIILISLSVALTGCYETTESCVELLNEYHSNKEIRVERFNQMFDSSEGSEEWERFVAKPERIELNYLYSFCPDILIRREK